MRGLPLLEKHSQTLARPQQAHSHYGQLAHHQPFHSPRTLESALAQAVLRIGSKDESMIWSLAVFHVLHIVSNSRMVQYFVEKWITFLTLYTPSRSRWLVAFPGRKFLTKMSFGGQAS